ncbi:hypothetical protein HRG_008126 [Hirsutella rhossiliensis]|uniref:Calcium-mediated lectin domain-containing protein n=1 Tax=Hirsutella rhossiliensis TaxID=111463 RepID=A0A9P8MRL9_9HYPO|nr:uncharacterized protein HRG_08126 [Hirsutella rhossiliensis]KAH0960973.1 hypothetical protein HRG_08126 [Hirsutella rhossiliensis]
MSEQTYVNVTGNKAEISFGEKWTGLNLRIKTNSKVVQRVEVKAGEESFEATGSGEGNNMILQRKFDSLQKAVATFTYESDGSFKPSKLRSGGPYDIGTYRLLVVVAENGDDADFNDIVFEFSGHGQK